MSESSRTVKPRKSIIPWTCLRCKEGGNLARLPETTLTHVRLAIISGHDRRSPTCHAKRGIAYCRAIFDGRTISFEKVEALISAGAVDGEDSTTATHTTGGTMHDAPIAQSPNAGMLGMAHGPQGSDGSRIPETVTNARARDLYSAASNLRRDIKAVAADCDVLRKAARPQEGVDQEVVANATLAYRCLEDASLRLGKMLQALDGGVSVYDKTTTVGAPA